MDFFPTVATARVVLAADVGGARGALTALGTLAFVAVCFAAVVLLDRRREAPAAPLATTPAAPSPGPTAGATHDPDGTHDPEATQDTGVADDVWPLRPRLSAGRVERDAPVSSQSLLAAVAGSVAALVVAACLIPVRADIGLSSIALALVLVVVGAAAFGGRVAAAVTSAVAALAFNFLHTAPRYTFHIADTANVVTSVLMILIGIAVGEVAVRRFRDRAGSPSAREVPAREVQDPVVPGGPGPAVRRVR